MSFQLSYIMSHLREEISGAYIDVDDV